MAEKFKILYIDDETDNLFGFKASFRMDYDVLLAESAAQAVQILEKSPDVRVVFCDQRMPTKTGTAFFEEMKQRFPLPVRILITAHTDIDVVITAINNGNIFRYIQNASYISNSVRSGIYAQPYGSKSQRMCHEKYILCSCGTIQDTVSFS